MTEPIPANNRGWIVVLAGIAINLILGSLYAWGVLAKALVVDWHWSRTDAALPFTVSTAAFAVMMIFAGRMQDRLGPRVVAVLGLQHSRIAPFLAFAIGVGQMVWIVVELAIIGEFSFLHPTMFLIGFGIAAASIPWGWPTFRAWRRNI